VPLCGHAPLSPTLFTVVEGGTRAWPRNPETMGAAVARHDALIERLIADHHGLVVRPVARVIVVSWCWCERRMRRQPRVRFSAR
jgi:hypothetical protein